VYACTAYVHVRTLGYIGGNRREIISTYGIYNNVVHVAEDCDACNGLGGVGMLRSLPCVDLCVCTHYIMAFIMEYPYRIHTYGPMSELQIYAQAQA
jgi:hypothetical protein